jgi:hypothetical protein
VAKLNKYTVKLAGKQMAVGRSLNNYSDRFGYHLQSCCPFLSFIFTSSVLCS